jgi:ribosomal protein S12 methylthiotransferase accessory factor
VEDCGRNHSGEIDQVTSGCEAHTGTPKRFREGTHRICTPEETWSTIRSLLPVCGITRVADVTALDTIGIPVFQAIRPASRNLSVSQGKGLTHAAARVSAAMEAIELWHAECLDPLPRTRASLREMRDINPIPASALRWSSGVRYVDSMAIEWIRVESLTGRRPGWLPRQMLELDDRVGRAFAPRAFDNTSSGLASGNCLHEAILHGLCELVERHAVYLADGTSGRRRALALDSVPQVCQRLVRQIQSAGMKVVLFDLTWEAALPCVLARLAAPDLPNVWIGSGCHPAPDVAVCRALTEAAQSRLTYIAGARDDLLAFELEHDPVALFEAFVQPSPERSFVDLPDQSTSSVQSDLDRVVALLESAGFEMFFADLTRPEVGVPVILSFVAGFREVHHA